LTGSLSEHIRFWGGMPLSGTVKFPCEEFDLIERPRSPSPF
jgi:hypothetical protein